MINHIKEVIYRAREDMIQDTAFILFNKWKKEQEDHKEAEQEDHKEEEQEEAIITDDINCPGVQKLVDINIGWMFE